MKHKFVGLGFFLLFVGLPLFFIAINFIRASAGPLSFHDGWPFVAIVSGVSVLVGVLILFISFLVFLVDKVNPPKVQS
jgi:hypothetical protein